MRKIFILLLLFNAVILSNAQTTLTGKKQAQITQLSEQKKAQQNFLSSSLIVLILTIVTAAVLFRSNRQKQKANVLLQSQKLEIDKKEGELAIQKDNLERSYNNVEQLGEIGRRIISSLSVETIIATVYDDVNSIMDAWVFGIGIYEEGRREIEFPATYENSAPLPAYSDSIDDKNRLAVLCLVNESEIIMGDLQTDYKKYLQNFPVPKQGELPVSLIYLPLKVKNKTKGVITVQSFRKNAYSNYHLYMLRNIANYAAIALENAESYQKLTHTLNNLKKTQAQLIQSEKMALPGELTGIAHEIQNPLHFVNNFSQVNRDLIQEIKNQKSLSAGQAGKLSNEELDKLFVDIETNEEKIIHHAKRADAIVKTILQHSRQKTSQKEPTDINALADDYLRLRYRGMRAKDKSFNATLQTNFDTSI